MKEPYEHPEGDYGRFHDALLESVTVSPPVGGDVNLYLILEDGQRFRLQLEGPQSVWIDGLCHQNVVFDTCLCSRIEEVPDLVLKSVPIDSDNFGPGEDVGSLMKKGFKLFYWCASIGALVTAICRRVMIFELEQGPSPYDDRGNSYPQRGPAQPIVQE